jgi:hypothetical protein
MSSTTSAQATPLFRFTPHRIVHLAAFATLAILACLKNERHAGRLYALMLVIGLGLLIETVQFVFSRTNPFEVWDARDDSLAACAGYLLAEGFFFASSVLKRTR